MSIFTDNPVLRREVRSRLRLRRMTSSRPLVWGAGVACLVIVYFYIRGLIAISRGQPQDARDLWSYLIVFLLLLVVIIAPALSSTAITQEREQQTWDSLATTNLTGGEVLFGKWLARLSLTGLPGLVLLPFLIGCAARGAISVWTNLATLLFLALTAGAYGVLGLLCSFFVRKSVTATVTALTVTLFLCVGTAILAALFSDFARDATADLSYRDPIVLWLNPFYALYALVIDLSHQSVGMIQLVGSPAPAGAVAVYCVTSSLVTAVGLLIMTLRFRTAARE